MQSKLLDIQVFDKSNTTEYKFNNIFLQEQCYSVIAEINDNNARHKILTHALLKLFCVDNVSYNSSK